jgi:hypothetical protein
MEPKRNCPICVDRPPGIVSEYNTLRRPALLHTDAFPSPNTTVATALTAAVES